MDGTVVSRLLPPTTKQHRWVREPDSRSHFWRVRHMKSMCGSSIPCPMSAEVLRRWSWMACAS